MESTETLNFMVGATTTTAVTSSVNPSQFDQGVAFTATVSSASGTPTGTVTFFNGSSQLGASTLSAGKATLQPITTLLLGPRSITATYSGNASFAASTSPVFTQTVDKAATITALTSSPNPSATCPYSHIYGYSDWVFWGQPRRHSNLQERHDGLGQRDGERIDT